MPRPHRIPVVLCGVVCVVAGAGLSPAPASGATAPVTVLSVDFDDQSGQVAAPSLTGRAASRLDSEVLTADRGTARAVPSHPGGGTALRLPAYETTTPPYAVLRVGTTGSTTDPLDPAGGTFSWSAQFVQDANLGGQASAGDNIMQRGLTSSKSGNTMWKLQADHHAVTCEVQTARMTAPRLTAPITVSPGTWYRATCIRDTSATPTLTAVVESFDGSRWVPVERSAPVKGVSGSVSMPAETPISIGGKVDTAGTGLHSSPDQFNGVLDEIRLTFGP